MTQVSLADVSKVYPPGVHAVRELNLSVAGGELLVLVGPSGCGKSTTLRLVAGLEQVSAGVIRFGGEAVQDLPPASRHVSMVFQEDALQPHLSVRENLTFGPQLRHGWLDRLWRGGKTDPLIKGDIKKTANEAARMLGIEHLLDRRPWQLSGGQKQRVQIGRAIVSRPRVLLMDEPLSNLDPALREQLRSDLKQLHRRMTFTTIYVTHDQVDAMTLGERIAVMDKGSILQTGTPLEVYDRPNCRHVAGMLGSPSMNFVDGEIVLDGSDMRFVGGGLAMAMPSAKSARLGEHVGRQVVLGVRPEHICVHSGGSATSRGTCLAKIAVVETLGDSTILRLRPQGSSETMLTCKQQGRFGGGADAEVRMEVDVAHCHVFDGQDGKNLTIDTDQAVSE